MPRTFTAFLAVLAVLFVARAASADSAARAERQKEHEAKIVDSLQQKSPEAVVPFLRARKAEESNDAATAAAEYGKVLELVPDFTPAMRRRAIALDEMGQRADALDLARKAVKKDGSAENEMSLAIVLLGVAEKNGKPPAGDEREAMVHAQRAASMKPDDVDFQGVRCQAALATQNESELRACSDKMLNLAPDEASSHTFAAIAALMRGDTSRARIETASARRLGGSTAMLDKLDKIADEQEPFYAKYGPLLGKVVVGWLVGMALLLGLGAILSRATLGITRKLTPDDRSGSQGATLRSVYRAVLHLSCLYYYLSLPLVLLLVVVIGGGIIVGFFMIGHIPIKLVAVVGILTLVTVWSVLKSVFVRPRDDDPGTPVDLRKNPELGKVIEEVAARVGTRPVDTVYMTPHTDIAVFERGGFGKQLRGGSERCLVLGVGVLEGMKIAPFKAILAHEYGHFSNRDTAGGGFALAVRRSLLHTAIALAQGGAAGWYNPAWLFLNGFYKVFLRISHGASRLQEIMADRWAAFSYGPEAFARGLKHVIRRSVEFDAHVQHTIVEVVEQERALSNLYLYRPEKNVEAKDVDTAVEEIMTKEPSPYDSHPRPADRIAWVRELATSAAPREDDEKEVWDLFAERADLERRMTDEVCTAVLVNHGVVIKRDGSAEAAPAAG